MFEKLLYQQISKGKSQSAQNTTHMDNPICKEIIMKTNLSHEHLAKGSTHASRVKPNVIHLYFNKSM